MRQSADIQKLLLFSLLAGYLKLGLNLDLSASSRSHPRHRPFYSNSSTFGRRPTVSRSASLKPLILKSAPFRGAALLLQFSQHIGADGSALKLALAKRWKDYAAKHYASVHNVSPSSIVLRNEMVLAPTTTLRAQPEGAFCQDGCLFTTFLPLGLRCIPKLTNYCNCLTRGFSGFE